MSVLTKSDPKFIFSYLMLTLSNSNRSVLSPYFFYLGSADIQGNV